jgi:hypothetical protein
MYKKTAFFYLAGPSVNLDLDSPQLKQGGVGFGL